MKGFVDVLLPACDWPLILLAAGGLLAIYALNAGLSVIVTYWGHRLGINLETAMHAKAFAHLQTPYQALHEAQVAPSAIFGKDAAE